ncbi:hypothetical protein [Nitrosopumilus sp. S6]
MEFFEVNVLERNDDTIKLDTDLDIIKNNVRSGKIALVRGMLSEEEAVHLRNFSKEFSTKIPESSPSVKSGTPNYHRIDNNPEKSKVKSILHLYSFFYWNDESKSVQNYFKRQFKLRNLLSDLPEDYALSEIKDGFVSVPLVQQYPRGGGYMQEHKDPDVGQKVIVNTILSKIPDDYGEGGLFCRNEKGEKEYIDSLLNPGDSIIFYPSIQHGVDPVDPNFPLDWTRSDGRWMCFSTLVTVSSLSGDSDTAGKPIYN